MGLIWYHIIFYFVCFFNNCILPVPLVYQSHLYLFFSCLSSSINCTYYVFWYGILCIFLNVFWKPAIKIIIIIIIKVALSEQSIQLSLQVMKFINHKTQQPTRLAHTDITSDKIYIISMIDSGHHVPLCLIINHRVIVNLAVYQDGVSLLLEWISEYIHHTV